MSEYFANRDVMAEGADVRVVVEEPGRPAMDLEVAEGGMPPMTALTADDAVGGPGPLNAGGDFMPPVESLDAETISEDLITEDYPDQEPLGSGGSMNGPSAADEGEAYLRMRLAVVGDRLEVLDAWSVDGPLVVDPQLHGDLAYEVRCGDQQLCIASVPDAGELRGFPNPDGPPEQQGHAIAPDPAPEIAVRVPTTHVTVDDLDRVEVLLYRLKGGAPTGALDGASLAAQAEDRAREVARLSGLDLDALPAGRAADVRRALG